MNPPLSPRRRRLRWTFAALTSLLVVAIGFGVINHRRERPAAYRPGEASADITRDLARALPPGAPAPLLTNVTAAAGLAGFRNFAGTRTSQMPEDIGPGLAWGDFDNDGDDDLFLVSAGGSLSLPAAELQPCALYENRGDGTFRQVETFPELRIHGCGAAWGDYDHDRRLDLHVCNYLDYTANETDREKSSQQFESAVPFTLNPASFDAGANLLLHQEADGTFRDMAASLKMQNPEGRSLGAVWHDFDQDGWIDLYVANDVSDNVFYHNLGNGTFEDVSHPALVADYRSAMGLAVGDYDRDGDDDLHVTHWVAQENALYDNTWIQFMGTHAAPATGTGGPTKKYALRFFDLADQRGLGQIALPLVGWGTEFADLDQDGWPDLLVANGNTLEEPGPYPKRLKGQELLVFWNRRGEFFHNLAAVSPALSERHSSRGLATADYDGDGDLDFAVADLGEGVRLFRNDMAKGHWLKLRLRSRNAAGVTHGFGDNATATVWLDGVPLRRTVGGVSYLAQASHTLHWGLGDATRVPRLTVQWPAGGSQEFTGLDADAFYEISEGEPSLRRLSATAVPPDSSASPGFPTDTLAGRQRELEFWKVHRAAMDAMKVRQDNVEAIRLFREAIALNPRHEDARYYLGLCLASQGETAAALTALADLQQLNSQSHRAWQQWGVLRATSARDSSEFAAAEQALQRAQALNPEETGALLVLGEVALLRGNPQLADERLAAATHTNPKAVGGFFLRGYMAWKRGDLIAARTLLEQAGVAVGSDWQPRGATSEGDVHRKQHVEQTPLTGYWESWDGLPDLDSAFARLDSHLTARGSADRTQGDPSAGPVR